MVLLYGLEGTGSGGPEDFLLAIVILLAVFFGIIVAGKLSDRFL